MVTIDKEHVWRDSWDNVYSLLNTNLSDPKNRGRKWVFAAFPDVDAADFPGWPVVIINTPNVSRSSMTVASTPLKNYGLEIKVEVFSDSAEILKDLADSTLKVLEDNKVTLSNNGMKNFDLGVSSYDILRIGRWKKVHYMTLPCTWTHKVI